MDCGVWVLIVEIERGLPELGSSSFLFGLVGLNGFGNKCKPTFIC